MVTINCLGYILYLFKAYSARTIDANNTVKWKVAQNYQSKKKLNTLFEEDDVSVFVWSPSSFFPSLNRLIGPAIETARNPEILSDQFYNRVFSLTKRILELFKLFCIERERAKKEKVVVYYFN